MLSTTSGSWAQMVTAVALAGQQIRDARCPSAPAPITAMRVTQRRLLLVRNRLFGARQQPPDVGPV